ncbi:MAG: metal ABC transporter permease [Patescibacteria group bacterium]
MFSLLSYQFVQFAFVAGVLTAIICSLLGVAVVSRNMSLLGDSLSHLTFGAAAVAIFFSLPFYLVTIPAAIIGALVITKNIKNDSHTADSYVAAISTFGIAVGVIVASISKTSSINLESFLFGSILTVNIVDLIFLTILALIVLILFSVFYKNIFLVLFDPEQAEISGVKVQIYQSVISLLTGLAIAVAMKIVGALLVSALLVLPASISLRLVSGFVKSVFVSVIVAVLISIIGIIIALQLNTPTGPTIAIIAAAFFAMSIIIKSK